jgi:hypothetical protein
VGCETYEILFGSPEDAKIFTFKLHAQLVGVASFRDGLLVLVFDALPGGQRERILQLARSSSATHSRAVAKGT